MFNPDSKGPLRKVPKYNSVATKMPGVGKPPPTSSLAIIPPVSSHRRKNPILLVGGIQYSATRTS